MNTNPNLLETFDEKVIYFLGYIFEHGGNEYKPNDFSSDRSYPLAGVWDQDAFNRIMEALTNKGYISCENVTRMIGGKVLYIGLKLTEAGIREAKKALPQLPMVGLVNQNITTGDIATDEKINHARKLFFNDGATMDDMRSACETLSFVLEPLRDELKLAITAADVEAFFQLVNNFDIRHNKASTKTLVYPEQLEWVFYSLLNTINTYTKLKTRLTNL